jgi:hypothetical protein
LDESSVARGPSTCNIREIDVVVTVCTATTVGGAAACLAVPLSEDPDFDPHPVVAMTPTMHKQLAAKMSPNNFLFIK